MHDTGWFKSSRSSSGSDNCVEVRLTEAVTRIRDSKRPEAGQLTVTPSAFGEFLSGLR